MKNEVEIFYCDDVFENGNILSHSMIIGNESKKDAERIYENLKKTLLMTSKETDAFEEEINENSKILSLVTSLSEGRIYERTIEFRYC